MAKYIAIFVSIIFFIISVNSAVLEPSAEIIRNQDAEEGKYYQRVEDVKDSVDNEGEFESVKDELPIYPLQNKDNEPEQIEKHEIEHIEDTEDIKEEVNQETIVSRDVNEPAEISSSHVKRDKTKTEHYLNAVDSDSYGPEEDLDGTYHENIIENNAEVSDKADKLTSAYQNEVNEEFRNRLDGYDSFKSDIEIYDELINRFESKDYEVDLRENIESEEPRESSENDYDSDQILTSKETNESSENEIDIEKTSEGQIIKPDVLGSENYANAFPEVEKNTDEEVEEVNYYEDEPLHEMTDDTIETAKEEESSREESEENYTEDIEHDIENEEETTDIDEMDNEREDITKEEERDTEEEEEMGNEIETEEEGNEEDKEEQDTEYEDQSIEETAGENGEREGEKEEQENVDEVQPDNFDETIVETESEDSEEVEIEEANVGGEEEEGENIEELEENGAETESESEDPEDTHEEEAMESENEEENKEDKSEDKYDIIDDVYPLQPPSIRDHSIIYSALKESSMFDKEEQEEKEEEESEEETNVDHNNNVVLEEVEPPGSLVDIQMFPVEASEEQIQTNENDCSLPAETGPCRAYHKRFFYNSNIGECSVFVYGGCDGNANNFKTLDDCVNTCVKNSLNL